MILAGVECFPGATKASRHREPDEFDQAFFDQSRADGSGTISADQIVRGAGALFPECAFDSFKVGSDVVADFGAGCIEINTEIDGRARRLADIVMRITIGASAS